MADPRRPPTARPAPGGRPPAGRQRSTRPGWRRTTCCEAVRVDDAYTNLVLPLGAAPARAERPRRRLRHRARRRARCAGRAPTTRSSTPASTGRSRRSRRRCSTCCGSAPTSCCRCGCPRHAAISTTVDLVRARVGPGAGRVRQRRAAPGRRARPRRLGTPGRARPGRRPGRLRRRSRTATRAGWSRSCRRARRRPDELDALLAADNEPPRVVLVARPGPVDPRGAARRRPPRSRRTAWCWTAVTPARSPAVAEGRAGVQDEGSQLVALALARRRGRGRDERWLDLCAGPGGKAALLAALAAERGADLLAAELQPHRAAPGPPGAGRRRRRPRRGDRRRHPPAVAGRRRSTGCWSTRPAPGLGALRRRPEARWRRTSRRPRRPGAAAARAARRRRSTACGPGEWCSTRPARRCSPRPPEVVDRGARRRATTSRSRTPAPLLPEVPSAAGPVPNTLQLWPHRHQTDAMFMALLRRFTDFRAVHASSG